MSLGLALLLAFESFVFLQSRSLPIGSEWVFLAMMHVNVTGLGLLGFLLGRNVLKLVVDRRRGIVGAKLNTKFVVSFVFTAVLSSMALFVFSAFLVIHTVETYFELQLSEGLAQSLEIADAYYRESEGRTLEAARHIAAEIEDRGLMWQGASETFDAFISEQQAEHDLAVVEVFGAANEQLASATHSEVGVVAFEASDSELIEVGLRGLERATVEEAGPGELIRGVVPIRSTASPDEIAGVVVVNHFIPTSLGQRIDTVRQALAAYQRLSPSEGTFETSMLMLLLMIALIGILFSSWMGFRLAKQVTDPIQRLAAATEEVAAGNLDVRVEQRGEDEIGMLVAAFNRMATDLKASRGDLESRRALIEIILGAVAAGVISLDRNGVITSVNPSALSLLGVSGGRWVGRKLPEMLVGSAALETVDALLGRLATGGRETLRRQVPISIRGDLRVLNWTISRLGVGDEGGTSGFVVVIDDVTQILHGQRMVAWRDLARRIAHEIKNPLTPIQLSAQRLRRKLGDRLEDPEMRKLVEQSTDAITSQVDAMKLLLREFSSFAQLPATDPGPTDLNALVAATVGMYEGQQSIAFTTDLAADLPDLDLDREQIKRVILNLVDNAIGAIEAADPGPREISVFTRIDRAVGKVRLEVADTGCGIRSEDRARLFEPGFSTKANGTGIGLAIVSRIVSDHSGYVRVRSNEPRGARFIVELPVSPSAGPGSRIWRG